jgi:foldase protein prsA 3
MYKEDLSMANKKSTSSDSTKTTKKTTSSTKKTTVKKTGTTKTTKPVTKNVKAEEKTKTTVKKVEQPKAEMKKVEATVKKETKKIETPKKEVKNTQKTFNVKDNLNVIGGAIIILLLAINIILIINGHKVKLSDGKEIIASIDGKDFVADDLFDELKEQYGSNNLLNMVDKYIISKEVKDDSDAKTKAKENLESIRSQYESSGYEWETVLTQYGYSNEDELLNELTTSIQKENVAKQYLKDNLTDAEINEYYENQVYGTYTVKHILIKPATTDSMTDEEKSAAEDAAKAKAQEVIDKLNNGEDFTTLVKEYSEDTGSVDNEGLVENFTKGDVDDAFFTETNNLKNSEYSKEPVKSSYGYHVILRVSSTDKKALKDIKDEVMEKIVENKLSDDSTLYTKTWVDIRKKYNFTINDTTLKNAYEKTINS